MIQDLRNEIGRVILPYLPGMELDIEFAMLGGEWLIHLRGLPIGLLATGSVAYKDLWNWKGDVLTKFVIAVKEMLNPNAVPERPDLMLRLAAARAALEERWPTT